MTFDECLKFLNNHQEELSSEMPSLGIIDKAAEANAYFASGHREEYEE